MDRHVVEPRKGWQAVIEEQGLVFWKTELADGRIISYWTDDACYSLTGAEVYEFEASVRVLMEMLVEVGDYVVEENLFAQFGIPGWAVPRIKETWESEPPMLYGRFDFAYGPDGVPKLLEYNADTPTALLETALQWHWVIDQFGEGADQWNAVHEALVGRWRELHPRLPGEVVHMLHTTSERSGEDLMTVGYVAETAREAGIDSVIMGVESLGLTDEGFVDLEGRFVRTAFKLYPWEWIVHEDAAQAILDRMGTGPGQTLWIEPIWKMMWSNKGILPVLHRLYPGHENILPAYFEGERHDMDRFVRKPLLAREGANAYVVVDGEIVERGPDQDYGGEGHVVQQLTDLGDFGGMHPVMGVWTVDMEPVGLGIRESPGLITNNESRFVPHTIA